MTRGCVKVDIIRRRPFSPGATSPFSIPVFMMFKPGPCPPVISSGLSHQQESRLRNVLDNPSLLSICSEHLLALWAPSHTHVVPIWSHNWVLGVEKSPHILTPILFFSHNSLPVSHTILQSKEGKKFLGPQET